MISMVLFGGALVSYAFSVLLTIMLSLLILAANNESIGDAEYDEILVRGFVKPWMWMVYAFVFARGIIRGHRGGK